MRAPRTGPSLALASALAFGAARPAPAQPAPAQPAPAQPAAGRAAPAAFRARAAADSAAAAALGAGRTAGLVVLAVRGRDTLVARAYGRADVENDAPLTTDHTFQLASITKQFTAAAVLALVQDGRVALDSAVTRYLPGAPARALLRGRRVTVRQLLSHTAGLPDYADVPRDRALGPLHPPPDSLLGFVRGVPFLFAPGDQLRYSNTGFVLAGQLIERVTGRPYAAFVEERVLRPAGVARAHFCDPERLVPRLARGYAAGRAGLRPAAFVSPHEPWAAGGFCATAGDLATWNAALHGAAGGRVLAPATYAEMVRPAAVRGGRVGRYGLGVRLEAVAGRRAVSHGGDIDGFTTFTTYLPDDSLNVTVLVNTQGPTRADEVAAAVVAAALGPRPAAAPAPAPTAADVAALAGVYDNGDVEITPAADEAGRAAVRFRFGPMPPVLLRAEGRERGGWVFADARARLAFEAPPPGAASGARSPAVWADLGVALVRWARVP
jgi:CubicO group peptidase (beta-lactamase class C family)